jgi:hypothetical protein
MELVKVCTPDIPTLQLKAINLWRILYVILRSLSRNTSLHVCILSPFYSCVFCESLYVLFTVIGISLSEFSFEQYKDWWTPTCFYSQTNNIPSQ